MSSYPHSVFAQSLGQVCRWEQSAKLHVSHGGDADLDQQKSWRPGVCKNPIEISGNCAWLRTRQFDCTPLKVSGSFAIDFHGTRLRPWVRTSARGPMLCYTTPLQCRTNSCKRKAFCCRCCCHCCSVTSFNAAFQKLPFCEIWNKSASLSASIPIWLSSIGRLFWSKKNGSMSINQQCSSLG